MGKYDPLAEFLRTKGSSRVPMTFDEIEQVTGTKLPPKAQFHRAWWSNNPSNNVMTKVWLQAGYETEQVDMAARKLVFRRANEVPENSGGKPPTQEDKLNTHPLFGALKGLVIILPGTDLTQPADPDWANKDG